MPNIYNPVFQEEKNTIVMATASRYTVIAQLYILNALDAFQGFVRIKYVSIF